MYSFVDTDLLFYSYKLASISVSISCDDQFMHSLHPVLASIGVSITCDDQFMHSLHPLLALHYN